MRLWDLISFGMMTTTTTVTTSTITTTITITTTTTTTTTTIRTSHASTGVFVQSTPPSTPNTPII